MRSGSLSFAASVSGPATVGSGWLAGVSTFLTREAVEPPALSLRGKERRPFPCYCEGGEDDRNNLKQGQLSKEPLRASYDNAVTGFLLCL